MTVRTVLLQVAAENCDPVRSATAFALELARSLDAYLQALVLELDVITPRKVDEQEFDGRARAQIKHHNEGVLGAADALRAAARERGIDALVVTERSHLHSTPEIASDHARLFDLVVAGVSDEGLLSERLVAETLIFQSGRPVIIVPDNYDGDFNVERIVVAWDFSKVAARAMSDALPFLRRAAEVTLVMFGDDKEFLSSVGREDVLVGLRKRGVSANFMQLERGSQSIGDAINGAALNLGADLLVMGGYGHSRFRDFILGGATHAILRSPALPTLISH